MDIKKVPFILLIFTMLVVACSPAPMYSSSEYISIAPGDGQVAQLQLRGSLHIIETALSGKSGTHIMIKDNLYLFASNVKDAWGFVVINGDSYTPIEDFSVIAKNGNLVNCREFTCLVQFLRDNGWKSIPPSAVPSIIKTSLGSTVSWVSALATSLVTFFVVPAGIFEVPEEFAPYQIVG